MVSGDYYYSLLDLRCRLIVCCEQMRLGRPMTDAEVTALAEHLDDDERAVQGNRAAGTPITLADCRRLLVRALRHALETLDPTELTPTE